MGVDIAKIQSYVPNGEYTNYISNAGGSFRNCKCGYSLSCPDQLDIYNHEHTPVHEKWFSLKSGIKYEEPTLKDCSNYSELEMIKAILNGDEMLKEWYENENHKYQKEAQNYGTIIQRGCPVGATTNSWIPTEPIKSEALKRYESAFDKYFKYTSEKDMLTRFVNNPKWIPVSSKYSGYDTLKLRNELEQHETSFQEMLFFMGDSL